MYRRKILFTGTERRGGGEGSFYDVVFGTQTGLSRRERKITGPQKLNPHHHPHRSDRSTLRVVVVVIITLVAGVKCRFLGVAACLEQASGGFAVPTLDRKLEIRSDRSAETTN